MQSKDVHICTICLEGYKSPKLLPCFHTFCTNCLKDYVSRNARMGTFNCPLCRNSIFLPNGGVDSFQTNFYIEMSANLDGEDESDCLPCDVCGPRTRATHFCSNCEENFCTVCASAHIGMKISRDHTLTEIADTTTTHKAKSVSRAFCGKHQGEELKAVCEKCETLICFMCKINSHDNHPSEELTKKADGIRKGLNDRIILNKSYLEYLHKQLENTQSTKEKLSSLLVEELEALDRREETLKNAISASVKDMKQSLKATYQQKICASSLQYERLKNSEVMLSSALFESEKSLKEKSNVGIYQQEPGITAHLMSVESRCLVYKDDVNLVNDNTTKYFKAGQTDISQIKSMIGTLGEMNEASSTSISNDNVQTGAETSSALKRKPNTSKFTKTTWKGRKPGPLPTFTESIW